MNDNQDYPFGYSLDKMDVHAFLNMRDWLEKALSTLSSKAIVTMSA